MKSNVLRLITWATVLAAVLSALLLADTDAGLPPFAELHDGASGGPRGFDLPTAPTRAGPSSAVVGPASAASASSGH